MLVWPVTKLISEDTRVGNEYSNTFPLFCHIFKLGIKLGLLALRKLGPLAIRRTLTRFRLLPWFTDCRFSAGSGTELERGRRRERGGRERETDRRTERERERERIRFVPATLLPEECY